MVPVIAVIKEAINIVKAGQRKRSVLIDDAVKGDSRRGPFQIIVEVEVVKITPVVKSDDKILKVLFTVTREEVVRESITPVKRVVHKLISRGATVTFEPE